MSLGHAKRVAANYKMGGKVLPLVKGSSWKGPLDVIEVSDKEMTLFSPGSNQGQRMDFFSVSLVEITEDMGDRYQVRLELKQDSEPVFLNLNSKMYFMVLYAVFSHNNLPVRFEFSARRMKRQHKQAIKERMGNSFGFIGSFIGWLSRQLGRLGLCLLVPLLFLFPLIFFASIKRYFHPRGGPGDSFNAIDIMFQLLAVLLLTFILSKLVLLFGKWKRILRESVFSPPLQQSQPVQLSSVLLVEEAGQSVTCPAAQLKSEERQEDHTVQSLYDVLVD